MSFIHEFEAQFRAKLEGADDTDSLVRWTCEKLVESYRNGITAGKNGAVVKRQGESRRRGTYGKAK